MSRTADLQFMARAIRIAEKGRFSVHTNPRVGCVLARQNEIVSEGYHIRAGEGHAEANALSAAGDRAKGTTAYVTLEPCSFRGRTPSCAKALIDAGVSRVVVALLDPDPRNAGKGLEQLKAAGIEVESGLLQESAAQLIRGHIKRYTHGKPFVRLKLAMSLDGKTALSNGDSKWITGTAARADVQRLRAMSCAIVTGVQTVIDDDPQLSVREEELVAEHASIAASIDRPVYILDSQLRVPASAALLQRVSTVLVTATNTTRSLPVEVISLPDQTGQVDLSALLDELGRRGHNEVLFECGRTLAGSLISQALVDELIIYMAPLLMGADARSLLNLPEVDRMSDLAGLAIQDIRQIGDDVRITASLASPSKG